MSMLHRLYKDWRKYSTGGDHALEVALLMNMLAQVIKFSGDYDSLRLYIILMYLPLILFMALMRISDGKRWELYQQLEDWEKVRWALARRDTDYVKVFETDGKLYLNAVKK